MTNRILYKDDCIIELGHFQKRLLELLVLNKNRYINKYIIEEYVYESKDDPVKDEDIRGLIMRLKNKLDGKFINSKRGVGYKLGI